MKDVVFSGLLVLVASAALAAPQSPPPVMPDNRSPFHTVLQPSEAPKSSATVKRIMVCSLRNPTCDEHTARLVVKKTPADNIVCGPKALADLKLTLKDEERFDIQCDRPQQSAP